MRARSLVAACAIVVVAAACSNAGSSKPATTTAPPSNGPSTTASAADLKTNVPVSAPGVTSTQIGVAAITAKTNNLTGSYAPFVDGVKAYFAMVNANGGIYGRKLVVTADRDDQFFLNRQTVQQSLSQDHAFATFIATTGLTGADLLARANMPVFMWNINPNFAGHPTFFGDVGGICFTSAGHEQPYFAKQLGATKVGVLAYGIAQQSKDCATGIQNSFKKYPTAKVVYVDDSLGYAQPLGPQVTQMKQKGVTFVMTCVDLQESYTLAKEMNAQGMHAVQELPNGYDPDFIAKNAALMEGDIVSLQFVALEVTPQIKEIQDLLKYANQLHVKVHELTVYGWIEASQLYDGLVAAGPHFSQAAVVSALSRMTAETDNGLISPVDWTKGHLDPLKDPSALGPRECANAVIVKNGKFVPYESVPGKPWTCFTRSNPSVDNPAHVSFAP